MSDTKYTRLEIDAEQVEQAGTLRADGKTLPEIAEALGTNKGKAALLVLCATEKPYRAKTDAALAKAIAKDRQDGASWGTLMARSGLTEGACRQAYEDATGEDHTATNAGRGRPRHQDAA